MSEAITTVEKWLGENNKIGIDIFNKKYRRNNETFKAWLTRVSGDDEAIKKLILEKKFLFGGRILANRLVDDSEEKTTYSNCYVISPPEDNIESIYGTCMKLAKTYSRGGGCGIDISKLAPKGAKVRNQAKSTSGAVSFMETFSQVTKTIGQNGRRGALMISLDCTHPDLEEFIKIKGDLNKINDANISVKVDNDFMRAVENDLEWELFFYRDETGESISKVVKARDIFNLLCEYNWKYAEPGILFWDAITHHNLLNTNYDFEYAGVNPCAEEPLPAGGSCLLGAINLAAYVRDGKFDTKSLQADIPIIVKAMNDVLDEGLMKHPLLEQQQSVRDWRQIGIGIMGLADALIELNLTYGSEKAVKFCDRLGELIAQSALLASSHLARDYDTYPEYDCRVLQSSFFKTHANDQLTASVETYGLRNSQLLTIAPTGSISTMIGVSGGIEPIFAKSYERKTQSLHGEEVVYKIYTPIVEQYILENGVTEDELPEHFVTAKDIPYEERIKMQSVWQKHIDASISSTINLPNTATIDDVKNIYRLAWEYGLKGVTIYREGCEREGILVEEHTKAKEQNVKSSAEKTKMSESGKSIGLERHITTGCGTLHICAYFDEDGNLRNTYLSKGSSGGCNNFMIGLSRMISLSARNGVSVESIADQLNSCGVCPSYAVRRATKGDVSEGSCCPVAIGKALLSMHKEFNDGRINTILEDLENQVEEAKVIDPLPPPEPINLCVKCGNPLPNTEGCISCSICGHTNCS